MSILIFQYIINEIKKLKNIIILEYYENILAFLKFFLFNPEINILMIKK
jgi:hypothetical protein